MLVSRRVLAVLIVGLLSAGAVVLSTRVSAAPPMPVTPATVPTPVHPVCGLRSQLPPALFRLIIRLLQVNCGNPGGPTTTAPPPPADVFGFTGTLKLSRCQGTRAAPGLCTEPMATAGRVRIGDTVIDTAPDGTFQWLGTGTYDVQGIFEAPPAYIVDCPVTSVRGAGGGPVRIVFDPVCRVFPVTAATTTVTRTTTIIADYFGIEGYLLLETCNGTPAAPVDCGPGVRSAGQVRINREIHEVGESGFYRRNGISQADVQGIVAAPPGRIVDCPVVVVYGSGGGPNRRYDPVCRSFPAPHDHGH